jgi:uncharacterized membrane protein
MNKSRMEAFSDGVMAVLITVLVLELKVPHGGDWHALEPVLPVFFTYVLSFIFLGIYWSNHHHLLHMTTRVTGAILWANLHLLFWLSLVPFTTGWMGENAFAVVPTAAYGVVLFFAGIGYLILQTTIIAEQGREGKLAQALGRDVKGNLSGALYAIAIAICFYRPAISLCIYVGVALLWLVPDRRLESRLRE